MQLHLNRDLRHQHNVAHGICDYIVSEKGRNKMRINPWILKKQVVLLLKWSDHEMTEFFGS